MDHLDPYIACVTGAFALYLLLRQGRLTSKVIGTLLGLGTLVWLVVIVNTTVAGEIQPGQQVLFLLFGAIAISSAVRLITHGRPLYSALYFVLVVLSSSGLLLLLEAEFMAFALIIVYAGAILITYMFVLMLAQQASDSDHSSDMPIYDKLAREPGAAVIVGLILAGTLVSAATLGMQDLPPPVVQSRQDKVHGELLEQLPKRFKAAVLAVSPDFPWPPAVDDDGHMVQWDRSGPFVESRFTGEAPEIVRIDPDAMPTNTQHVGWALVASFPASLEIAVSYFSLPCSGRSSWHDARSSMEKMNCDAALDLIRFTHRKTLWQGRVSHDLPACFRPSRRSHLRTSSSSVHCCS